MRRKITMLVISILIVFLMIGLFWLSDSYFGEKAEIVINQKVTATTYTILATAGAKEFSKIEDTEGLVSYVLDENQSIQSILINSTIVNQMISKGTLALAQLLETNQIENAVENIKLPLGQLISTAFLASKGPNIHIEVLPITSYQVDVVTKTKEYGINNVLFEIYLKAVVEVEILVPLKQSKIECEYRYLIISQIIQGDTPRYYYTGSGDTMYIPEEQKN